MTAATFRAQNFRSLRSLTWSPEGVCLLVGPNGSGKSTVLDMLLFLRMLFSHGHEAAFAVVGGAEHFRRLGTPDNEPVTFEVEVGEVRWKLRFPMSQRGLSGTFGEELYRGSQPVLRAAMFDDGWYLGTDKQPMDGVRCCAKVHWDREEPSWLRPLKELLDKIWTYRPFCLSHVRRPESLGVHYLHYSGKNLWSVLSQWQLAKSRYPGQFDWVVQQAQRAFPGIFDRIEFDRGQPLLFLPGSDRPDDGLAPERVADGLLTALLVLTAVAGAAKGAIVAIDELGNHLHPHASRTLLAAMETWAEERALTIVLTTHSTVVLNAIHDPGKIFVLGERGRADSMAALLTLHDEDWLAQARLGTLYERLAFGAPAVPIPTDSDP